MRSFIRLIVAALAGSIAVGGFHPFEIWIFPLLSLVVALRALMDLALRWRLIGFYLYGLGFLLPLLHWSSTYVGSLPWILLATGFASFYALLAFGIRSNRVNPILFTLIFVVSESLRAIAPFGGFGWGRFGFSQLDGPLSQWLRIGGVSLSGGVVALVAAILVSNRRYWGWVAPVLIIGMISPSNASASDLDEATSIGLIQGGVSQLGLEFNATPREVLNRHLEETRKLLESAQVDLLIWPENASDIDPIVDPSVRSEIQSLLRRHQTPMVIGAVTQGISGPENVSILFDVENTTPSIYQKRDLVPFGEYVPLRSLAARFSSLVNEVNDFIPGGEIITHEIAGISFAPLICYEILDDRVAWDNVSQSSVGVVQTNNATFGRSWQSGQQFQMTRVRAFESRMPFVVAATTGDTAYIDSDGVVVEKLPKFQRDHLVVTVRGSDPQIPPVSPELLLGFSLLLSLSISIRDLRTFFSTSARSTTCNDLMES